MAKKCGCKANQVCGVCVKPSCHICGKPQTQANLKKHVIKCMQKR